VLAESTGEILSMSTADILADFHKSLEEMREMILVLGHDANDHYLAIQNDDSQSHRRAYIRSVFAFIEGTLHCMKMTTFHLGRVLGTILIQELLVLNGEAFDVDDKGNIVARTFYPKFLNNVKFSFKSFSKIFDSSFKLNLEGDGWKHLQKAVKVRDRLMHPKEITELQVTDAEVQLTKKAFDWFFISQVLCSNYAQKANQAKTPSTPENIEELDKRISDLEATLLAKGG
jgi:hypothetical protein